MSDKELKEIKVFLHCILIVVSIILGMILHNIVMY